eukprot:3123529-Rhodomonas_salina.1
MRRWTRWRQLATSTSARRPLTWSPWTASAGLALLPSPLPLFPSSFPYCPSVLLPAVLVRSPLLLPCMCRELWCSVEQSKANAFVPCGKAQGWAWAERKEGG